MKKLALAPAVAIAITGLAASPVIAAPEAPAQAAFDQTNVQSSTKQSNKEAEPQALEASATVSPETVSQSDLVEPGVKVTVTGLETGDVVSDDLTNETAPAAEGDTVSFNIVNKTGDPAAIEPGKIEFTVTVKRGEETQEIPLSFTVTEDGSDEPEAPEVDPKVSLNTDEISQSDFDENGIEVTGEGFTPNGTVTVVGGSAQSPFVTQEVEANADGEISATLKFEGDDALPAGDYSVWGVDQETETNSPAQDFTVTEDDDDAVDPIDASLKVDPKEITAEDLANREKGVTVTVSGVKKGDKITDSLTGETETAEADGDYELNLWYEGNPDNLEVGKVPFTVTIDREGTESETLEGEINVVGEDDGDDGSEDGNEDGSDGGKDGSDDGNDGETEAPAEASFTVSPKTLEAADFANENKGVTLAVENCEPGADVHFEVNPKGINVTAYENTVKADDEGNASVNVFGTSSDVSAYVGAYTATATCGDDTMKDSFTVTGGANGGGSDGGDNGNAGNGGDDGNQLPRTGSDLGGLTTGALLLLVGGAAIALTGRKNKFGQTPTSF